MKTLYTTTLLFLLCTFSSFSQCVDYGQIEYDITGTHGANFLLGQQVTVANSGVITEVGFHAQSSGQQIIVAIYSDNLGVPGTLITQSLSATVSAGVNIIDVPDVQVNSGAYWVMKVVNANTTISELSSVSANTVYVSLTFGNNLPSVIVNSSSYTDDLFTVWVEVCPPCNAPDIPILGYSPFPLCENNAATIQITGNLNDATAWHVYSDSCNGNLVGTTAFGIFNVNPSVTTTYYIRGEGGCTVPSTCAPITVNVVPNQDASFSYSSNTYCTNDIDPVPNITGTLGGIFSSQPAGLSINANTGIIDVSASNVGGYSVIYTTPGPCVTVSEVGVMISTVDASTNVNNLTITATQNNATYQWLDCNNNFAPINGAINQSYVVTQNGDYAVQVTANGCVDTSDCVSMKSVGIEKVDFGDDIKIYSPNGSNELIIALGNTTNQIETRIISITGRIVQTHTAQQTNNIRIPIHLPTGLYLIELSNADGIITTRKIFIE